MSAADGPAPGFDADRFGRLSAFAGALRPVYPRADQFLRFTAYLVGLLAPGDRKNVEAIAVRAAGLLPAEANPVQALQHFITRSPWDAGELLAACRRTLPLSDPQSVWVLHDAVFPKRGRHSVGVQRQFARSLGRKVNCQIGVVLGQLGPAGYFPLAARLYLPRFWLRENPELVEKTIPEPHRRPATKGEIALALLAELRGEGRAPGSGRVLAEVGYAADRELLAGLPALGLAIANESDDPMAEALRRFDRLRNDLGLDHFEGRTWAGWHHHVSLVFTAYAFLATEPAGRSRLPTPARSTISC